MSALTLGALLCGSTSTLLAQAQQTPNSPSTIPSSENPRGVTGDRKPATTPSGSNPGRSGGKPSPSAAVKPSTPQVAANNSPGPPATQTTLEERLRRMEEAYLRMEQSNREIRSQYSTLLRKYDDLNRKVSNPRGIEPGAAPSRTRPASRSPSRTAAATLPGRSPFASQPRPDAIEDDGSPAPRRFTMDQPLGELEAIASADPSFQPPSGAQGTGGRSQPGTRSLILPPGGEGEIGRGSLPEVPLPPSTMSRMDRIGAGAEGTGGRTYPRQQLGAAAARAAEGAGEEGKVTRDVGPTRHTGHFAFGEGLEFTSDDDEFKLQFHNLTQAEFRGFPTRDQGVLQSQFFVPRQRWYFVGDLTRRVGFYTVINRGYGSLDLLDAFISLRFSNALRLRAGRMKTPYLYEYFSIAEGDLIAPERSIFAGNLALNRQIGFMFLGDLLNSRVSYAAGLFNGPRRSFQDFNTPKDFIGTVTARPFLTSERFKALNYLNIGASWDVGYEQNNPPQPIIFETANDQTLNNAQSLSPTFLTLNKNVIELGERIQWGAHIAWYYKSFFLLAEYGGVRSGYGIVNENPSTPVNMNGWNVTASYFLTGEQITRRVSVVKPRRDFNFDFLKPGGRFSPGAVELFGRYSTLDIGRNIFTAGLADPNLWTNHVWATDFGVNWYLNFYTRIYLDWQHAQFGNQVSVAPSKYSANTDIIWLRLQVFF